MSRYGVKPPTSTPQTPVRMPQFQPQPLNPTPGWESDADLQRIRALSQQNLAGASASELAQRKQALQSFGYDPALQGLYPDEASAEVARQNPFSVLANLSRAHSERTRNLDENLNKSNLFYSGYRGTQLGNEATQYLGEQSQAQTTLQGLLTGLANQLLAAKSAEQERVSSAESDAYNRWVAEQQATGGFSTQPVVGQPLGDMTSLSSLLQKKRKKR